MKNRMLFDYINSLDSQNNGHKITGNCFLFMPVVMVLLEQTIGDY